LFGANQGTGTSFGGSGTTLGQTTGASNPFGTSQTQTKPSFLGGSGGGLGGGTGSTGGGFFGGTGGLGTNQPTQGSNPFGGFGTQNQQGQQGQDQNKTGGLFGSGGLGTTQASQSQPAGGLFGTTQPSTGSGGLFGGGTSGQSTTGFGGAGQSTGGGLFGGSGTQQQKPSLFGGTGSFGGAQTQSTGGLFGGGNTNPQQQGGGLFGGASTNTGGLFSASQQQQKPSLFGTTQSNTSIQNNGLFGGQSTNSLFNTSQQSQQTPQQPQALHSSLLDGNPYGQASIWSGLPEATPQNSGPLVTPLSASQRLRESQMKTIPSFRLSSTNFMTPPRRQGYGFTYSTYGSPNSAASTPGGGGLSSSMYGRSFTGGSFGRSVGKSFSATNLRQQFAADGESVLSPGAFAPGSSRYSSGSIRRLTIDRNVKADLFSRPVPTQPALPAPSSNVNGVTNGTSNGEAPNSSTLPEQPSKLKKRVSFDNNITGGTHDGSVNGVNGTLVRTETDGPEPTAEEQGFLRSSRRGKPMNGTSSAPPQMEQVRGKELAVVPEDRETDNVISKMRLPTDAPAVVDPKPGEYWMKPSRAELSRMPREKLQHFKVLQVGRQGCGFVTFDEEVDLTTVPLDDLFGKIVEIRIRSITVYSDASTKPPPGKGLNVPSTLHLENSWPRARGAPSSATTGPLFDRHILRLKRMPNTQYVSYDTQTGVWTFKVAHYTRYGLDYDDEEESDDGSNGSGLSDPPDNLAEPEQTPRAENEANSQMDIDDNTPEESSPDDDTFDFKRKIVPGGFGQQSAIDYDQEESFLDDRAAGAASGSEKSYESEQEGSEDEVNMVGSFPQPHHLTQPEESPARSTMKTSRHPWDTPGKPLIDLDGDWAEQLQRTISPRKQNREALRDIQGRVLLDRVTLPTKQQTVSNENEIRTNIDLMNSLFGQHEERIALSRKKNEGEHGIEV
jgi:nuclear pore complex protein Nup98-Nup96